MKSIRLSLMVYFLGLLGLALGAVSFLGYRTAYQTLLAKQEATAALITAQCQDQCRQAETKLNENLQNQARMLARLVQFQPAWMRLRYRELGALGMLTAGVTPNGQLLTPVWVAEAVRGKVGFELLYGGMSEQERRATEIKLNESELLQHFDDPDQVPEFFQINAAWNARYRSLSLGEREFAFDHSKVFSLDKVLDVEIDDVPLGDGRVVRRVKYPVPIARFLFWGPPRMSRSPRPARDDEAARDDRSGRSEVRGPDGKVTREGEGRSAAPDARPQYPPPPPSEQLRPLIFIQCATNLDKLRDALAGLQEQRETELAVLQARTASQLADLRTQLILIGLLSFAATMLGGFWLVWLGLSPLQRLSEAVSQVSPKDFRLPLDRHQMPVELKPIVARLTETLELLKRTFAREKQAAADISHELRTPLSALLTTTEVALRKPRTEEEYRELLEDCRASGQQMSRLVERLLTLARLDAGVDTLRPCAVDVAELAEQCVSLVRPLAQAREVQLTLHRNGPAEITADPDKVREVLTNLLHNAIEYNRPHGRIDVHVARQNGHLRLEVCDTGIGISRDAQGHIFERFYRADSARQADGLHAGLGLAIVKGYVDLMGGHIAVESVEGQGSQFRVELPARADSRAEVRS